MPKTPNLGLNMPLQSDQYNIDRHNENSATCSRQDVRMHCDRRRNGDSYIGMSKYTI